MFDSLLCTGLLNEYSTYMYLLSDYLQNNVQCINVYKSFKNFSVCTLY